MGNGANDGEQFVHRAPLRQWSELAWAAASGTSFMAIAGQFLTTIYILQIVTWLTSSKFNF